MNSNPPFSCQLISRVAGLLGAVLLLSLTGCEYDCGVPDPLNGQCPCIQPIAVDSILPVRDFEAADPLATEACHSLGMWQEALDSIHVAVQRDGGGTQHYASLYISGNTGAGPQKWTGGGLVIPLTACVEGLDLSDYSDLLFDVRLLPGSRLHNLTVSLQDVAREATPERQVQSGTFKIDENWRTARLPLESFTRLRTSEIGHAVPLDLRSVIALETQSVHDGTSPYDVDGELQIDNIRFIQ